MERNSTSFPVQVTALLRDTYRDYKELRAKGWPDGPTDEEARTALVLKYYQFLVRALMTNPEFGIGTTGSTSSSRGLLVYHSMGLGKTYLANAISMAMWDVRRPIVLAAKSLHANFGTSLRKLIALLHPELSGPGARQLQEMQDAAVKRFRFVSMDAYNMADQITRATTGSAGGKGGVGAGAATLDGTLLVVDEAHNFFRAIINSADENTNARRLYNMIMEARNLRIVFLTGTPASKDPFEFVPCFNMLAGWDVLPPHYDIFYKYYVDRAARRVRNRNKLANRLLGLVSHAGHTLPSDLSLDGKEIAASVRASTREKGGFPEEFPLKVERVEMFPDQYRQYLLAREKEEAEGGTGGDRGPAPERLQTIAATLALPGTEREGGSTYYVRSRMLSNYAPPRDYVPGMPGDPASVTQIDVDKLPKDAFTTETSPKIVQMLKNIEKSPGPALVYSQFVDSGGLKTVARFMREEGYVAFAPPTAPGHKGAAESGVGLMQFVREPGDREAGDGVYCPDSVFTHDGDDYSRDCALRTVAGNPTKRFDIDRLTWVSAHPEVDERRVAAADLDAPILVTRRKTRDVVVDGAHRLTKAFRQGRKTLPGRRISTGRVATGGGPARDTRKEGHRYAIISGDVPPEERAAIAKTWNSPANLRGAVIRVLLVSKTGAEGLDLKYGRQVHILEPYWDKAREDQVIARFVRLGSHDDLPVEDRDVQPYLYIAVPNSTVLAGIPSDSQELETIDMRFHERAAAKHELNSDFRRLAQEVSIECSLYSAGGAHFPGQCRVCLPTNAPLFHEDAERDLRLPDPCEPLTEGEIEAMELEYQGVVYYYEEDPTTALGYRFYRYDDKLEAHAQVDPADPLYMQLLAHLRKGDTRARCRRVGGAAQK